MRRPEPYGDGRDGASGCTPSSFLARLFDRFDRCSSNRSSLTKVWALP